MSQWCMWNCQTLIVFVVLLWVTQNVSICCELVVLLLTLLKLKNVWMLGLKQVWLCLDTEKNTSPYLKCWTGLLRKKADICVQLMLLSSKSNALVESEIHSVWIVESIWCVWHLRSDSSSVTQLFVQHKQTLFSSVSGWTVFVLVYFWMCLSGTRLAQTYIWWLGDSSWYLRKVCVSALFACCLSNLSHEDSLSWWKNINLSGILLI